MKFSKIHIFIFLISFALTTTFVWFLLPSNKNTENMYFTEGYNFHKLRLDNYDIDTVKIGEKLNIANIKDAKNNSLSSTSNKKLFLLVAIDPFCPACNFSKDMVENIRTTTKSIEISYSPILISPVKPNFDTQKYVESFGFDNYFYWTSDLSMPNPLSQVITPTHILIDKGGTVVKVWYGSNKNNAVRKRMGNQITADLILINDVFGISSISQFSN